MSWSHPLLLPGCRSVKGWYSGTLINTQETLAFRVSTGVRLMNEFYPLERVAEEYDRVIGVRADSGSC